MTLQAARLTQALADLPEEQAELVRMAFLQDEGEGRIAAETNLLRGAVESYPGLVPTILRETPARVGRVA
ncbi:MAG: hypothetical protein Tsb0032_11990 [Kiloniellaceae bacterium]